MLRGIFRKLNSDNLQLKTTTDISWKYCRFAELRQGEYRQSTNITNSLWRTTHWKPTVTLGNLSIVLKII